MKITLEQHYNFMILSNFPWPRKAKETVMRKTTFKVCVCCTGYRKNRCPKEEKEAMVRPTDAFGHGDSKKWPLHNIAMVLVLKGKST